MAGSWRGINVQCTRVTTGAKRNKMAGRRMERRWDRGTAVFVIVAVIGTSVVTSLANGRRACVRDHSGHKLRSAQVRLDNASQPFPSRSQVLCHHGSHFEFHPSFVLYSRHVLKSTMRRVALQVNPAG